MTDNSLAPEVSYSGAIFTALLLKAMCLIKRSFKASRPKERASRSILPQLYGLLFTMFAVSTLQAEEAGAGGHAECSSLVKSIENTRTRVDRLQELTQETQAFLTLDELAVIDLTRVFGVELTDAEAVTVYLNSATPKLPTRIKQEERAKESCQVFNEELRTLQAEYKTLWQEWRALQKPSLMLSPARKRLLSDVVAAWNRLVSLKESLDKSSADERADTQWVLYTAEAWKQVLKLWWPAFTGAELKGPEQRGFAVSRVYQQSLEKFTEQSQYLKTMQLELAVSFDDETSQALEAMQTLWWDLRLQVYRSAQQLRNIDTDGSLDIYASSQSDLFHYAVEELVVLPYAIQQHFSVPYQKDIAAYKAKDNLPALFLFWVMEALVSVFVFFLLLRISVLVPKHMSGVQQALMGKFENQLLSRVINSVFWFLKANVGWLILLLGSISIANLAPSSWQVFAYIEFWGSAIALAAALNVIAEWLLDRAITKSGQYLTPKLLSEVDDRSRSFAWLSVVVWAPVVAVYMLSGYVSLLVGGALALLIWWIFAVRLLAYYGDHIDRFTFSKSLLSKLEGFKKAKVLGVVYVWCRPIWFMFAQFIDNLQSLNQRLMYFDSYRAMSVKILRLRLENKEEKEADDDEALEPDQSYSSWLLREVDVTSEWIESPNVEFFMQPIRQWKDGVSDENVTYVLGEPGSGKTSLARYLQTHWKDCDVSYTAVPAKTLSAEDLFKLVAQALDRHSLSGVAELVKREDAIPPRVVVLDDAHNLFLSAVGSLDAYRAFIQCLNAQVENVFWVVMMDSASWNYLDCVFSREFRVANVFQMKKWTPGEIRKLILARHKGSRRRLKYDDMLLSAAARNEYSSVRAADSRLFNIVWEQSQGNPMVALHLWLSAARSKGRYVEVGMPQKPDIAVLKGLKDDLCFIFAAIVTHESMTSNEITLATNYSNAIVRHALKQGLNLGILERLSDRRYTVTPLWYKTLSQFLTSKNMIWNK